MESIVATLPSSALAPERAAAIAGPPRVGSPIRKALSLSVLNTAIGRAGTLVTGIILARLLRPADFGVYAVAFVVLNGMLSLNELGVSLALVRWREDPRTIAPTVTTIAIGTSVLLYVACWLTAPALASGLGAPNATGVIRLLSLSVVIDGLTSTPAQLLNRDFRQGRRLLVDTSNLLLTTGVTIAMAADHYGAWSLAGGQLVGNAFSALLLFHLAKSWPRPGFNRKQAIELLRFGLPLAAASALLIGMLNLQFVITGSMLGEVALGMYLLAFNLSSWPVNVFSVVVRRISLAVFARVQDDPAGRQQALTRMLVLLASATLPVCTLLGLLAFPLITTVYGTKWAAAAAALPFLAMLGLVRVAAELAYDFLAALGRSRTTLWLQLGWICMLAAALPVGASLDGIRGVAVANGAVALIVMLPAYGWAIARTGVSSMPILRQLMRPVAGCLVLASAVLAVRLLTDPSPLLLVAAGALGIALYTPIVWPLRHVLRQLD